MSITTREASDFTRYCGAKARYVLVPKGVTIERDAITVFIATTA
jgi:hypothetical protein